MVMVPQAPVSACVDSAAHQPDALARASLARRVSVPVSRTVRLVQIADCQQSAIAILGPECLSGNERVEWWSEGDQIVRAAAGRFAGKWERKRAADNPLCAGRPTFLNFSPVVEDKQI